MSETTAASAQAGWQFWFERGGTFTDVIGLAPDRRMVTRKLLSSGLDRDPDAALQGIRDLLGLKAGERLPTEQIAAVKIATTAATQALLERTGGPTVLAITKGFGDQLRIGDQARPDPFALRIVMPELLYQRVVEIDERLGADGTELVPLDGEAARAGLSAAFAAGLRACAIVLMHGDRYPAHEVELAEIARAIGFPHVSVSHQVCPLIGLVGRGETTVAEASLSPLLRPDHDRLAAELGPARLLLMQADGVVTAAGQCLGKTMIGSGPAAGVIGAVRTGRLAGFDRIIGFGMGGVETNLCHFAGEYERALETVVGGVRLLGPRLELETVAVGGHSICWFDGTELRVGPGLAGADPGPACAGRGGPLTLTDCNVMVGKLHPRFFPSIFGPDRDQPLDLGPVQRGFAELAAEIAAAGSDRLPPIAVADGFLAIAVQNLAEAIRRIALQRGCDLADYILNGFGGAGGQHACLLADALGLSRVLIHPLAGVLAAYGIGLAREPALEHNEPALEHNLEPIRPVPPSSQLPRRLATVASYMAGAEQTTPVYDRPALQPGNRVFGPAILVESTATTIVEPGWMAETTVRNHLLLTRIEPSAGRIRSGGETDPITRTLVKRQLRSVTDQMAATLQRATSPDHACALFDATGTLVAIAAPVPVDLGAVGDSVRRVIERRRDGLKPGDVTLHNDPYHGGTGWADLTVITPFFGSDRTGPQFYLATRRNHPDLGGAMPGVMLAESRAIPDQGVRFDAQLVVEDGVFLEVALREQFTEGRTPAGIVPRLLTDLKAQIAANQSGGQALGQLIARFGLEGVRLAVATELDQAERRVRQVLAALTPGRCAVELDHGAEIKVAVAIDRAAGSATIDFSGTSAQLDNNLNLPSALCRAAVMFVVRSLIDDEGPFNDGWLRPLRIVIPPNSMLSPSDPGAVAAGILETLPCVVDTLYGALGLVAAGPGTRNILSFSSGKRQYLEMIGGGAGAGPDFDGASAVHTHLTGARLTDPEWLESNFPVLVDRFAIRSGSGGAGRQRGGDGIIRRLRFLEPLTATLLADRRRVPPFGLDGGQAGEPGRARVERADGRLLRLSGHDRVTLDVGDVLVVETPGGGGFGVV